MLFKNTSLNNPDLRKVLTTAQYWWPHAFHGVAKMKTNMFDVIAQWMAGQRSPQFFSYGVYVGEIIAPLCSFCLVFLCVRPRFCFCFVNMLVALFFMSQHGFVLFALNEMAG